MISSAVDFVRLVTLGYRGMLARANLQNTLRNTQRGEAPLNPRPLVETPQPIQTKSEKL